MPDAPTIREVKGLAPIKVRPLVFMDLEFFGFGRRQPVCEFAAIKRRVDGTEEPLELKIAMTDYEIANAEPGALKVNGFNREEWADATPKTTAFALIHNFVASATVLGFNVDNDIRKLEQEFGYSDIPTVRRWCQPIEIATILREKHRDWGKWNLDEACQRFGLEREGTHRAMGGARRAMQVWDKLMNE